MSKSNPSAFLNASHFFTIAKSNYVKLTNDSIFLGKEDEILISIIFSVVSLECFVNEIGMFVRAPRDAQCPRKPDFIKKLGNKFYKWERESKKPTLPDKLLAVKKILTGNPFIKGKTPYQDFSLLYALRNSIVHFKPEKYHWTIGTQGQPIFAPVEAPKLLKGLRAKKLLGPINSFSFEEDSFLDLICTREVAKWACETAVKMVNAITNGTPDSPYTFLIKSHSHFFKMGSKKNP